MLVVGGWDRGTQEWAHPDVKILFWAVDGVPYALWTSGGDVSAADLIEMAESMP